MAAQDRTTIIVNKKPHHLDTEEVTPDVLRHLANLPDDYEAWKIVGEPDPEGQLPANDVQVTGRLHVKSGDRFRVVPPGTFGTAASLPGTLTGEVDELRQDGYSVETHEEPDYVVLVITDWPLPAGYNKTRTNLLVRMPRSYPFGKPDMFWVDKEVRLANSQPPRQTNTEQVLGAEWLRFSWHAGKWDPARDNLRTFLAFIEDGLSKARF